MNIIETISVQCPYCGEIMDLQIDCSEGDQEFMEDCPLCCKPVTIAVTISDNGISSVDARPEDD
ncbi:MAG: CPXCG motif-containing cysteine-rich protein [Chlorobium sp.]|nr:MAG: CPXCG motif-containing cysteine-rich protein [Chlorobium sp.]